MNDSRAFLDRCRIGSGAAYDAFKELLARLDDPDQRAAARRLLGGVVARLFAHGAAGEQQAAFHVAVRRLPTGAAPAPGGAVAAAGRNDQDELTLLQLPGVFAPEEWSYTFFEGLARYPATELEGLTVAELGCGNGWISLALARRCLPRKVWALDVNPRAVACARLNLYANALDDDGEPILDASGRSLLDRVEVATSDLLERCREAGERLDRVVGCIPQVLRPDLDLTLEAVSETASDEFLYSLSNYTGKQGYVEDQFGLGLIARAVEESVELLRPAGHMIFNLGGRPGRGVLRRLFERRGVEVREVWTTTIPQAGDTDIQPLAEIEQSTPHRFEFYLGRHAEEPVSATTAGAYLQAGGTISHSLTVFDGRVRFPSPTRRILGHLAGETFRAARSALDLAYPDDAQAEEKASFLARLADDLGARRAFPYGPTAGERTLRRHLAEYLHRYFDVSLSEDRLVVAPSRQALVANLLTLYRPQRALLDPELARHLPCCLAGPAEPGGKIEILEGVRRADLACRLIEALRPGLAVVVPAEPEARSVGVFERLIETAEAVGCRLVIDLSPYLELSSTPQPIGVFRALAERPLPPHAAVICGLIKNRVYADLEVAFLATEDPDLLQALAGAAEVTYSRAPALAQRYYDVIVEELLAFRIGREEARAEAGRLRGGALHRPRSAGGDGGVEPPPLAPPCRRAFEHPAMVAERLPIDARTVRFDYGENSLPAPDVVREALSESFARQNLTEEEVDPSAEIRELLARRLGFLGGTGNRGGAGEGGACGPGRGWIVLGLGVADLFAALIRGGLTGGVGAADLTGLGAEPGTMLFPAGSYGFFVAAVQLFGGREAVVETDRRDRFKVTPERLEAAVERALGCGSAEGPPVWLFLNAPVVNPTGALYTPDEIEALLGVAASRRVPVILDAIFSGLELDPDARRWHLDAMIERTGAEVVVLGGLSKELAAGGIRMGWAATGSPTIAAALDAGQPSVPHSTIRFATRRMVARLIDPEGAGAATAAQLAAQRSLLADRARHLSRVLEECGWEPLAPEGGLFLVARPRAYLGKTIEVETDRGPATLELDAQSITQALFWSERLLVNGDVWTGIPGWCRFAFAVEEAELAEGIERLRRFARRMGVGG